MGKRKFHGVQRQKLIMMASKSIDHLMETYFQKLAG